MRAESLSRFTPSLMPYEQLDRLFVAREHTLESIMGRLARAATSAERNHTLVVGPRGSGKTHLISLVYHRTNDLRAEGAALQVAWLPEDPWTIASYRHLLCAIRERLEPPAVETAPKSEADLEAFLAQRAKDDGPIVLIVENFDQVLNAIGEEGQQRLRHHFQAHRSFVCVATSTRLDRTLSDQASPFYGFFTTTQLKPFDVEDAVAMLTAIAKERGDERLGAYLDTEAGRSRLRTIAHLAGGQPRIWATLASALTVEGLDTLIDLLLTRFDDLTPYYQGQLAALSGHQRLVVAELAELDRPINVSELARRLEIDQRSLGKTMTELVDRGWVAPLSSPVVEMLDKRRTYYELAEPLARLSFQIKESRGRPLRLVVEFLKHWFDPTDLVTARTGGRAEEYAVLATYEHHHDAEVAVARRLRRLPLTRVASVQLLGEVDDAIASLAIEEPEPFLRLPSAVRSAIEDRLSSGQALDVRRELHHAALEEFGHVRHPSMAPWIARTEDWVTSSMGAERISAQLLLAKWLGRAWRFDEATEVLGAIEPSHGYRDLLRARSDVGESLNWAGHTRDAIELEEAVFSERRIAFGIDDPDTLKSRESLAVCHRHLGDASYATELGEALVADSTRVLGADHPDTLIAKGNLAVALIDVGRVEEAMSIEREVLKGRQKALGPDHPDTLVARACVAVSTLHAGEIDAAVQLETELLADRERVLGPDHADTLTSRGSLAVAYFYAGRFDEAIELERAVLAAQERLLGEDHPDTLLVRSNLAGSYWQADQPLEALRLQESVVADRERVLGVDHPDTLRSRGDLAAMYLQAGRGAEAVQLEESVLAARERVLGPDHLDTIIARNNLVNSYLETGRVEEATHLAGLAEKIKHRALSSDDPDAAHKRRELETSFRAGSRRHDAKAFRP